MSSIIRKLRELHGTVHEKLYSKKIEEKMEQNVILKQQNCKIKVLDIDGTLDELEKGKSMSRFGDGEMEIILGNEIGFQRKDEKLAKKMKAILAENPNNNMLICVPDALVTMENLTQESTKHWVQNMTQHHDDWVKVLNTEYTYGTTNVTRCYMRYKDKSNSKRWFHRLQNLWADQNVVMVEGYETRVGVGNDMLDNAKSVKRILCPSENAFDKYEEILEYISSNISKDNILLLALGPTATVLAWDLAKKGYRTLDIGHCDIEYSWCNMGVTQKTVVEGKYTNEVAGGNIVADFVDKNYIDEIIAKI